jgi:aspartate carbamoyltransferase catalytic subunit
LTTASPPGQSSGSGLIPIPASISKLQSWNRKHLLGLEDLSKAEILAILDTAASFAEVSKRSRKKVPALQGRIVFNLFFENSTRTRTSFSLAAKRLSADTQDFSTSASSLSKGETFIDTAKNIEAMGADVMVVRHPTPGAPHLLAQHVKASIINAGDGAHEHPTQGLLDLMTIRQAKGRIEGLTVGLLGDIAHSPLSRRILTLLYDDSGSNPAGPARLAIACAWADQPGRGADARGG